VGLVAPKLVAFIGSIPKVALEMKPVVESGAASAAKAHEAADQLKVLLEGLIKLSEAQVQATVRLEKTAAALVQAIQGPSPQAPSHAPGGISAYNPDAASREWELSQIERSGVSREEAIIMKENDDWMEGLGRAVSQ